MKIYQFLMLFFLFFAFSQIADSQNIKENELVVIQGERFVLHQVRTGETVYSISRDFKIESTLLQKHNPGISEGLSIGDILKIPFNENVDLSQFPNIKKGDPTDFLSHTINSNSETAYSISKTYKITVEEVYAYNPTVQRFKKGLVLKIPQWNFKPKTDINENVQEQQVINQNKTSKDLIEHTVVSGETLYSIGKKYQITESEIIQFNPDAVNLRAGSKLLLPVKQAENKTGISASEKTVQGKYVNHTIVSGETLFGLTKKYQVTEDELKSVNPELSTSFRTGTVLKIPVKENNLNQPETINDVVEFVNKTSEPVSEVEQTLKIPVDCVQEKSGITNKTFVVALFLPLFLDANDELNNQIILEETDTLSQIEEVKGIAISDTIIEEAKPLQLTRQFYGNSENFLQFYEGVLIAVDSMQKAGMKIELNVFDTKDNPESVRKIINSEDFAVTDLILGPVYENVQKEVALIAAKHQIPVVSPFTPKSGIISSNPQFYQINPTREYLAETTIDMIVAGYAESNFIVVGTSSYAGTPEGQMVEYIRKKLDSGGGKYTEYDFRKERSRGLKNILLPDMENVIFIPSSDEGELSVAISNINNLADEYSITLIGTSNYQQKYPSIEVAHYHNLKLKYINPYWIDYSKNTTKNYIEKFVVSFGTEPNSYGIQGFDAAWYFLNALYYYGKDFNACLPYLNLDLLQGNYYFKRVSSAGGFMNQGVSVISYNRNFEVERQRVIGQPKIEGAN